MNGGAIRNAKMARPYPVFDTVDKLIFISLRDKVSALKRIFFIAISAEGRSASCLLLVIMKYSCALQVVEVYLLGAQNRNYRSPDVGEAIIILFIGIIFNFGPFALGDRAGSIEMGKLFGRAAIKMYLDLRG